MKKIFCLFFIISIVSCSKDEVKKTAIINSVNLVWSKTFGGSASDLVHDIITTSDGGHIIIGDTSSSDGDVSGNNGAPDIWVLKLDVSGNKQWAKSFGGSSSDYGFSVVSTADGGYAVVGRTSSTDGDISDNDSDGTEILLLKLDASGNKQWAKTYGGSGDDEAIDMIITSDGSYIIAGNTTSTDGDVSGNHGTADIWVLKLNSSGTIQWSKTFGGSDEEYLTSMTAVADGGYAITGYTKSTDGDITTNRGLSDVWVLKLNASGTKQWSKTYGGSGYDEGSSITTTPDKGYAIVGNTVSTDGDFTTNRGMEDISVIKLDASGNKQWAKTFGGSSYDYAASVATTSGGLYIVSGYIDSTDGDVIANHGAQDGFVLALNTSGDKLLTKTFGGSGYDYMGPMIITTDGKCIVIGNTTSTDGDIPNNQGSYDCWVMQLNFQ